MGSIPPTLPIILLIGWHLVKSRGGKRGQISPMIRLVRQFPSARVTTGFLAILAALRALSAK